LTVNIWDISSIILDMPFIERLICLMTLNWSNSIGENTAL